MTFVLQALLALAPEPKQSRRLVNRPYIAVALIGQRYALRTIFPGRAPVSRPFSWTAWPLT